MPCEEQPVYYTLVRIAIHKTTRNRYLFIGEAVHLQPKAHAISMVTTYVVAIYMHVTVYGASLVATKIASMNPALKLHNLLTIYIYIRILSHVLIIATINCNCNTVQLLKEKLENYARTMAI